MSQSKDSTSRVLLVALALCVVCSILVSAVAVGLRDRQDANALRDKQRNVLLAAGLIDESFSGDLAPLLKDIEELRVDLSTGKPIPDGETATFNMRSASSNPKLAVAVTPEEYPAGIKSRPSEVVVYLHREAGKLKTVILPVVGNGLWSTMYGFLALEPDLNTTRGLVFYEQAETPGLGGEVDNPRWRNQFRGTKKLFRDNGTYALTVVKIGQPTNLPPEHKVDGISGATITGRGVHGMLQYWVTDVYGPFFQWLKSGESER